MDEEEEEGGVAQQPPPSPPTSHTQRLTGPPESAPFFSRLYLHLLISAALRTKRTFLSSKKKLLTSCSNLVMIPGAGLLDSLSPRHSHNTSEPSTEQRRTTRDPGGPLKPTEDH